jgi:hypothetical protein
MLEVWFYQTCALLLIFSVTEYHPAWSDLQFRDNFSEPYWCILISVHFFSM